MTGLLSVVSLLPVQALKQKDEEEEVEEEAVISATSATSAVKPPCGRSSLTQDDGAFSDEEAER